MSNSIEILSLEKSAFAAGQDFEGAGAYERLLGKVKISLSPADFASHKIVDLEHAPLDDKGIIRCDTNFFILKPVVRQPGPARAIFEFSNRGNKTALATFNDAPEENTPELPAHAGNGFLFRKGYSCIWLGWQGDLLASPGKMVFEAPIASQNGEPIRGIVRREFIIEINGITKIPLSSGEESLCYPPTSSNDKSARLTRRRAPDSEPEDIPRSNWSLIYDGLDPNDHGVYLSGKQSRLVYLCVTSGLEPGWIYDLTYTAECPLVLGLGYALVHVFVSSIKAGAPDVEKLLAMRPGDLVYAFGLSQSARAIRDFIYRGFNERPLEQQIFDGALIQGSGAGRLWTGRFADLSATPSQQYENHFDPGDRFPFSYAPCRDEFSEVDDAIFKRPKSDPKLIDILSATEYWQRRGSLVHTNVFGEDLELPKNVRVYFWEGIPHAAQPQYKPFRLDCCQNLVNTIWRTPLFRASLARLDDWVKSGLEPPANLIPTRALGTLLSFEEWQLQFCWSQNLLTPSSPNELPRLDFGPAWPDGVITREPPIVIQQSAYVVGVPGTDLDGNELGGLKTPALEIPLGTYTGWNIRKAELNQTAMYGLIGSFIPFQSDEEGCLAVSDSRTPIDKRYNDRDVFSELVSAAIDRLIDEGWILEGDRVLYLENCLATYESVVGKQ